MEAKMTTEMGWRLSADNGNGQMLTSRQNMPYNMDPRLHDWRWQREALMWRQQQQQQSWQHGNGDGNGGRIGAVVARAATVAMAATDKNSNGGGRHQSTKETAVVAAGILAAWQWQQRRRLQCTGWTKWEATKIADKLEAS